MRGNDPHRPFAFERRAIPLKADLETKFERAQEVVGEERIAARVDSVLAVLKGEPQVVQEGVIAGLRAMLGKKYAKASEGRRKVRAPASARDVAEAVFAKTEAA